MKKIFTLASALFLTAGLSAKVIYVAPDGANANDGASWDKAVADISKAYSLASAGDEIWMAGGTYVMNDGTGLLVDMKDQVNVYGSFKKGDTNIADRVRNNAATKPYEFANPTVFTSEGVVLSQRPFGRSNTTTEWQGAILDGLTFQDLATNNGKLLFLQTGVTMQNCVVKDCGGSEILVYFEGNGLMKDCLVEGSYVVGSKSFYAVRVCGSNGFKKVNNVDNVTFRNNNEGTVLHIYNYPNAVGRSYVKNCTFDSNKTYCLSFKNDGASTPILVDHCLFENNVATTAANTVGEGVVTTGQSSSAVAVTNCIIRNNENTAAASADSKNAVVALNSGTMKLVNSLVYNNKSNHASVYSGGHIINSTIVNNAGAISVATKSQSSFINNIFVGNTSVDGSAIFTADSESNIEFVYNAIAAADVKVAHPDAFVDYYVSGVDASSFVAPTATAGLVSAADAAKADFSLAASSPAINAGVWYFSDYGMDAYPNTIVNYIDGTEIHKEAEEAYTKDIAGNARVVNGKINLGAYQGANNTAVDNITVNAANATVYGTTGAIMIEVADAADAYVYTLSGALVKVASLEAGMNAVEVAGNALYVVKVGNAAYKAIVK